MSVGKGSGCREVIRDSARPMDSGRAACQSASGAVLSGSIASVVTRVTVSSQMLYFKTYCTCTQALCNSCRHG